MEKFSPVHLIIIIAIVVIGFGLIFRGAGDPNASVGATHTQSDQQQSVALPAKPVTVQDIAKRADDIPPPITRTTNELVEISLTTEEVVAEMMPGVTYTYWTYNGTVPGPLLRVREGDDVRVTLSHGTGGHDHSALRLEQFDTVEDAEAFFGAHVAHAAEDGHDHEHAEDAHMHDDSHPHTTAASDGDEVSAQHAAEGHALHSIDLHSVIGPGGGAALMQVGHDGPKTFQFKATHPGVYVYHCASPHVPTHIANGMYGLIVVEPASGMAEVDKEFYVMQGDFYTTGAFGELGHQEFDKAKLLAEDPSYFVFNGRVGGLKGDNAMHAKAGERIRMYVGVGSHIASNFHIIGGIFDKLYKDGSITSPPLTNVQTTIIPAGGAVMIEFTPEVPGTYLLVDHSLTRVFDKGALAELVVEGADRPDLYRAVEQP